jgi:hypothetical protein
MKPMHVNSISGLDMSTTRQEAKAGCAFLEVKISSFFTDEFRCFISMQSMADAQIVIYPSKSKVTVTRMGYGQSNETEDSSDLYIKWKYLVLTRLMEKIQEDYGSTPFKEANNFISNLKAKVESTIKINSVKSPFALHNHDKIDFSQFRINIALITKQNQPSKKPRRNRTLSVFIKDHNAAENLQETCSEAFLKNGYKALKLKNGHIGIAVTSEDEVIVFEYESHRTQRNTLFFKENKAYTKRLVFSK